jgi:hypothetical protein
MDRPLDSVSPRASLSALVQRVLTELHHRGSPRQMINIHFENTMNQPPSANATLPRDEEVHFVLRVEGKTSLFKQGKVLQDNNMMISRFGMLTRPNFASAEMHLHVEPEM